MPEWTAKDARDKEGDKEKYIRCDGALPCECEFVCVCAHVCSHVSACTCTEALHIYVHCGHKSTLRVMDWEPMRLRVLQSPPSLLLPPEGHSPCGCCFPHVQWWFAGCWEEGPFFSCALALCTAGSGRLRTCLLPWTLLSGGGLVRCCKSSWLSRSWLLNNWSAGFLLTFTTAAGIYWVLGVRLHCVSSPWAALVAREECYEAGVAIIPSPDEKTGRGGVPQPTQGGFWNRPRPLGPQQRGPS